jgi:peptidoglycan glycosyltransferase
MIISFALTLIFTVVSLLLMAVMGWAAWRHRNPPVELSDVAEGLGEFGPIATNRWLRGLRLFLVLLITTALGFHSYWVFGVNSNENFARAKRLDVRNRRLAESGLKGWVLDRSGRLENALIRYQYKAGLITREYPLGPMAVHLTGYSDFVYGAGGIEYAMRSWLTEPASTLNWLRSPVPAGKDAKVSIDSGLQREVFSLLQSTGKAAAAIVLLLPNNEVLAMASTPSFDASVLTDEATWQRLTEQAENAPLISPLVNRALGTLVTGGVAFYYRPGSTFKVFIAGLAIDNGITDEVFHCRAEGFTPPGSNRAIHDFGGEVHGRLGFRDAFRVSCNQYFAQLGLKLGRERIAGYAKRLGFATSPEASGRVVNLWQVIHGDQKDFDFIFAPPIGRMNLTPKATNFDIALQSFGQGYADLTPIEMALIAAAAASPDGALVAPTLEVGGQRKIISHFISPHSAAQLRLLMRSVVESGTAAGAFASLRGRISAGGKTGTADREVIAYDRQGNPIVDYIDKEGNQHYKTQNYTDGWFIGFAPAENPQIAYAVIVENGGQGARSAAPIAAKIVEKAAALGYVTVGRPSPPSR